jgi:hypothetical protein
LRILLPLSSLISALPLMISARLLIDMMSGAFDWQRA